MAEENILREVEEKPTSRSSSKTPGAKGFRIFPECVAKGSRSTFGGLGVDTCLRDPASVVRARPS